MTGKLETKAPLPEHTGENGQSRRNAGWFRKGQSGNPNGRPRGARCKLGEAFFQALLEDWQEHGREVIAKVRADDPATYLRIVASLMPREVDLGEETADTLREVLERIDGRSRTLTH